MVYWLATLANLSDKMSIKSTSTLKIDSDKIPEDEKGKTIVSDLRQ